MCCGRGQWVHAECFLILFPKNRRKSKISWRCQDCLIMGCNNLVPIFSARVAKCISWSYVWCAAGIASWSTTCSLIAQAGNIFTKNFITYSQKEMARFRKKSLHMFFVYVGNQVKCHEATVFKSVSGKLFLYRSKHGDWVVGECHGSENTLDRS